MENSLLDPLRCRYAVNMDHQLDSNNGKIGAYTEFSQSFERMNFDSFHKQTDQLRIDFAKWGRSKLSERQKFEDIFSIKNFQKNGKAHTLYSCQECISSHLAPFQALRPIKNTPYARKRSRSNPLLQPLTHAPVAKKTKLAAAACLYKAANTSFQHQYGECIDASLQAALNLERKRTSAEKLSEKKKILLEVKKKREMHLADKAVSMQYGHRVSKTKTRELIMVQTHESRSEGMLLYLEWNLFNL